MRELIELIRDLYPGRERIPLHEPVFQGNEEAYTHEAIRSTFVSSVGAFVDRFESELADATGAERAVAVVNGTSALHAALHAFDVGPGDLVVTQSFSFVATANAIRYTGADPVFIDIDPATLGLDPDRLEDFLRSECGRTDSGLCLHNRSQRVVRACVPMHTFGHPCRVDRIGHICREWGIELIEDAAESMGSTYEGQHTGTFGAVGAVSFNGNKILTAGAGGALLTNHDRGAELKHLTTTAKEHHAWGFRHDRLGFNYRMPNLNAALACAQLEQLDRFVEAKRTVARRYQQACEGLGIGFVTEPAGSRSNYWLNAILVDSRPERDRWLETMHASGVMARPGWDPLHTLPMYSGCVRGELPHTADIFGRLINLPSSANASRAE
jgi:aminotransferase in exopolysaccharide biosynthesis